VYFQLNHKLKYKIDEFSRTSDYDSAVAAWRWRHMKTNGHR